jgi:hypothetical protein
MRFRLKQGLSPDTPIGEVTGFFSGIDELRVWHVSFWEWIDLLQHC